MSRDDLVARTRIERATAADVPDLLRLLSVQLREHRVRLEDAGLARAIDGVLADPARGSSVPRPADPADPPTPRA